MKNAKKKLYDPAPGSLLIFYGGKIWHRVEEIEGIVSRITSGGFLNFSKDGKKSLLSDKNLKLRKVAWKGLI